MAESRQTYAQQFQAQSANADDTGSPDEINYLGPDAIEVGEEWSAVYALDALDDVAFRPNDPVRARFTRSDPRGGARVGRDFYVEAGKWTGWTDGAKHAWQGVQFRLPEGETTPTTVQLTLNCRG